MQDATAKTKVWLDMDQAALDAAYDQAVYAPNQKAVHDRRLLMSAITLQRLGEPQVIAYGSGANHTFDLYRAKGENRPLVIYVHGGAWKNGRARDFAVLAETFVCAGAHVAILDFDLVQDCNGDLRPMVKCGARPPRSVRRPKHTAPIRRAFILWDIPQARIWAAASSPPTG